MYEIRLHKFLAKSGTASLRKSEELIKQGRVAVNGLVVREMGVKIPENSLVEVDGKRVDLKERKVYIMLNKPAGYVTTVKDQFSRATVMDLIKDVKERVYPAGRLDYDTSGLLLLTNDGELTYRLTHPRHELKKVYAAEVEGIPSEEDLENFKQGVEIEGFITSPAGIKVLKKKVETAIVEITIHEGKNRQVKRMCEAIGHPVLKLKRIAVDNLKLRDLPEGEWRYLSAKEIEWLKRF